MGKTPPLQGNTAPYLQYAVARIHSIFRKAQKKPSDFVKAENPPSTNSEKNSLENYAFSLLQLNKQRRN